MKVLSAIFTVLLIFSLSACSENKQENKNIKENELFELNQSMEDSETLKIVTEKEKYSAEDTVIRYSITNVGDTEGCIAGDDHCFTLQILKDGEWMRVGTKIEQYWNELALILPAGQTENREINLNEYFHLPLEKGEYRIAVENLVSNTFEISS